MSIKNYAVNFSDINATGTVSDCHIKRRKMLKFVGHYNISLLLEALTKLDLKPNTKKVAIYALPHAWDKSTNLLIFENLNRAGSGVCVAPMQPPTKTGV